MVTIADAVNGCFELFGGAFLMLNVQRLMRDKRVAGVRIAPVMFFTAWGFWNLYYYPSLGQWASFAGGIAVVGVNTLWIGLALWYGRRRSDGRG